MAAHELSVGALDIPPRGSYQQRDLERALRSLEFEIEFVNAQLEAAKDEEGDDLPGHAPCGDAWDNCTDEHPFDHARRPAR